MVRTKSGQSDGSDRRFPGPFARRYWRFVACLAFSPIHDHPTFSTIQRAEIVARMDQNGGSMNQVWLIEVISDGGQTVLVSLYEEFNEAMKEIANLLLSGQTVRMIKLDVKDRFSD